MKKPKDKDEYISMHTPAIQAVLKKMDATIRKNAPEAEELISYGMPAFKLNGMLVWYAAHTSHLGFYPKTTGIAAFKNELKEYKFSKGTIQFPFDKPLPVRLISRIVRFRVAENQKKTKSKKL